MAIFGMITALVFAMTAIASPEAPHVVTDFYVETDATSGRFTVSWEAKGPLEMPAFTVDPRLLIVQVRRIDTGAPPRKLVPVTSSPLRSTKTEMTMERFTSVGVKFEAISLEAGGTYAFTSDARLAVRPTPKFSTLQSGPTYFYIPRVPAAGQPDAEVVELKRNFASHAAKTLQPFVVGCADGSSSVVPSAGSTVTVAKIERTGTQVTGSGADGRHASTTDDDRRQHPFTTVHAIVVTMNVPSTGDGCTQGLALFASSRDVMRYLRPATEPLLPGSISGDIILATDARGRAAHLPGTALHLHVQRTDGGIPREVGVVKFASVTTAGGVREMDYQITSLPTGVPLSIYIDPVSVPDTSPSPAGSASPLQFNAILDGGGKQPNYRRTLTREAPNLSGIDFVAEN